MCQQQIHIFMRVFCGGFVGCPKLVFLAHFQRVLGNLS